MEYQEKLAAFKAASSASTAIPLAEEILRIAIVRNFKISWVTLRLNVAVTDILFPTICCTRKETPPPVRGPSDTEVTLDHGHPRGPRAIKFGGDATGVPNEATRGGLAVGLAEMEIKFSIISGLVGL